MTIGIAGAGAFGGALAVVLARAGKPVVLWGRDPDAMALARSSRRLPRLPDVVLPDLLELTTDLGDLADMPVLLAVPMQTLSDLLARPDLPQTGPLIACCKGIDLRTGTGPTAIIAAARPGTPAAILTGPSFATDIAQGLPTALTLACTDAAVTIDLQAALAAPSLRLYRSTDPLGAELGGALKNVIAIAAGLVIGAGLGQSARAALMARGFAEMQRLAIPLGAKPETLTGLAGLGDLVLTCTSDLSRNFAFGKALGAGLPPKSGATIEGPATAKAALALARRHNIDMPLTAMVSAVCEGAMTVHQAMDTLMQREPKAE